MKVSFFVCPTCGRDHKEDEEFGRFCCASCLQTIIRPLIVAMTNAVKSSGVRRGRSDQKWKGKDMTTPLPPLPTLVKS
jgi:protein-arginine kinase activator protein McsA